MFWMLVLETIAKIRRLSLVQGKSIKAICRELKISRKVVRKVLRSEETEFRYERKHQPYPRMGAWRETLDRLLSANAAKPQRERLTLIRIFEELRGLGYDGSYSSGWRHAQSWAAERGSAVAEAYIPLSFAPGEAYQFDWSHEIVLLDGMTVTVKVAHMRLCHSRMFFVRAYPRETQEMVFDAHDRAFAFFRGACTRGIYDNMKTAVDAIFIGRDRRYNRRFAQMCGALPCRAGGLHTGGGLGEGASREPGRAGARALLHTEAALQDVGGSQRLAGRQMRCPMPRRVGIPNRVSARSGTYSKKNAPASFPMPVASTATIAFPRRCRRPARCASTTTNTRCCRAPSVGRSRSMLMPTASSSARMARSSASTHALSAATRSSTIPGTTCRCWPANRTACATARLSGNGFCHQPWRRCAAS